jgi:hypothetical protein
MTADTCPRILIVTVNGETADQIDRDEVPAGPDPRSIGAGRASLGLSPIRLVVQKSSARRATDHDPTSELRADP